MAMSPSDQVAEQIQILKARLASVMLIVVAAYSEHDYLYKLGVTSTITLPTHGFPMQSPEFRYTQQQLPRVALLRASLLCQPGRS